MAKLINKKLRMIASMRTTKPCEITRQRKLQHTSVGLRVISNPDGKKFLKCDKTNRGSSTFNTFPLKKNMLP
jgi:hypothetical protein